MSEKTMRAIALQVSTEKYKDLGLVSVTFERYPSGYYVDVKNPSIQRILALLEKSEKSRTEITVTLQGNMIEDVSE